jgi:hypothetical protein
MAIWSTAEVSTTIMAACVPLLRNLVGFLPGNANRSDPEASPVGQDNMSGSFPTLSDESKPLESPNSVTRGEKVQSAGSDGISEKASLRPTS